MSFGGHKVIVGGAGFSSEPLPEGTYDAVLSAIIDLQIQMTTFKGVESPKPQVKLIFEIPSELRTYKEDEDPQPVLIGQTVTLSANSRSKLSEVICALVGKKLEEEEVADILCTDGALEELLGKPCTLDINVYKSKRGTEHNGIQQVSKIHPKVEPPVSVKEPFIFEANKPNLDVFKNKLSRYTRDTIITCVNSDELPKDLHKAYRDIKIEEEKQDAERGDK